MYFLRSRIRKISGLLFSLLEGQNEADSEVISWNEFYYAGSGTDCTSSGITETGAEIPPKGCVRSWLGSSCAVSAEAAVVPFAAGNGCSIYGKLIRHKTLADGDGECNYWIFGDKDPDALADVGAK